MQKKVHSHSVKKKIFTKLVTSYSKCRIIMPENVIEYDFISHLKKIFTEPFFSAAVSTRIVSNAQRSP